MRLNTDSADKMPVTDAVYGRRGFKPQNKKVRRPRGHSFPMIADKWPSE